MAQLRSATITVNFRFRKRKQGKKLYTKEHDAAQGIVDAFAGTDIEIETIEMPTYNFVVIGDRVEPV